MSESIKEFMLAGLQDVANDLDTEAKAMLPTLSEAGAQELQNVISYVQEMIDEVKRWDG